MFSSLTTVFCRECLRSAASVLSTFGTACVISTDTVVFRPTIIGSIKFHYKLHATSRLFASILAWGKFESVLGKIKFFQCVFVPGNDFITEYSFAISKRFVWENTSYENGASMTPVVENLGAVLKIFFFIIRKSLNLVYSYFKRNIVQIITSGWR